MVTAKNTVTGGIGDSSASTAMTLTKMTKTRMMTIEPICNSFERGEIISLLM